MNDSVSKVTSMIAYLNSNISILQSVNSTVGKFITLPSEDAEALRKRINDIIKALKEQIRALEASRRKMQDNTIKEGWY